MKSASHTTILSDLAHIQSDRAAEYKQLALQLKATDLDQSTLLTRYAEEGRRFAIELKQKLKNSPETARADEEGNLYNSWKREIEGYHRKGMPVSAELPAMERLSVQLFSEVLNKAEWSPALQQFLRNQRDALAETGKMLETYYARHPILPAH